MTSARGAHPPSQPSGERRKTLLLVGMFVAGALALRIVLSYHGVFGQDFVAFLESDAWYHMRLVDATVRHFPHRLWYDAYLVYPGGEAVNAGPFFDWVIALSALIAGLGAPSDRLVDVVGAYVPTVFGALTCVPVYVLGRLFFSRSAGLWAAFIVGVLPGEILQRSILGFTDHHCAETLLTTCVLMAVASALSNASPRSAIRWSVVAGFALGCYLLTWGGGGLIIAILICWAILELMVARLSGDTGVTVVRSLLPALIVAASMITPWIGTRPYFLYDIAALAGSGAVAVVLWLAGRVTLKRPHGHWWYVLVILAGAAAAIFVGMSLVDGLSGLRGELSRFSLFRAGPFVREATPLMRSDDWRPVPLWGEFGTSLLLAVAAVLYQTVSANHRWIVPTTAAPHAGRMRLLLVWTTVMLAATFAQIRFTYYLAVNVALLAGLGCALMLDLVERTSRRLWRPGFWRVATVLLLGGTVLAPTLRRGSEDLWKVGTPSPDWYDALIWLETNTPEPFGDDRAYYRPPGEGNMMPPGGYGVMAWWEYGYWITRIAHRIPNSNPRQTNLTTVASFMVAEEPAAAAAILDKMHSRYVIVNWELQATVPAVPDADTRTLFGAIAALAGHNPSRYCDRVEARQNDTIKTYCYPAYYRTMAIRLYAFGGRKVVPQKVNVIKLAHRRRGMTTRRLLQETTFATQEQAEAFIRERPLEEWRIASDDPLASCVTLEPLPEFRRAFHSMGVQPTSTGLDGPSTVQVYEYSRRSDSRTPNDSRGAGG